MDNEQLKIFDENRNQIGVATREEVHRMGYWHEAFHCWFVTKEKDTDYVYLQLRSQTKKDYPGLLDITAAGHILAYETVLDGVREIKEEIGIDVPLDKLVHLGVIDYCVIKEDFIDKELANVFLYKQNQIFDDFTLQLEEVSGIVKVVFNDFADLWYGKKESVNVQGFRLNEDGDKILLKEKFGREKFVPHQVSFYQTVIQKIKENI
ncbi:NUDIX hydrolase [Bacillus sp. T33-2]|uniref:NUDIX hydrolase n=1 Tax=Bacillus sp. T33-2 TaxID=2054168 RepID=UPI000C76FE8A|nr:NUDIX domain-containing protein [Bacillus sp. T33-2]PLR95982.1 NUDIX hydrolase [Bacillus sp. T33-2]